MRKTSHAHISWKPFPLLIIDKFAIFLFIPISFLMIWIMINSFQFSCRLSLQTKTQLYSQPVKGDGIEIPILSEISERHYEQPKDTCFCNCHAMLLSYQFVKYINSISPFMRSYFKFREVPYNLRRIQFISFHRQGLQFMALTLCIFLGPSFGINYFPI